MAKSEPNFSKTCGYCNKPYKAIRETSKFCSNGCRQMDYKIRHNVSLPKWRIEEIKKRIPTKTETQLQEEIKKVEFLLDEKNKLEEKINSGTYKTDIENAYNTEIGKINDIPHYKFSITKGLYDSSQKQINVKSEVKTYEDIIKYFYLNMVGYGNISSSVYNAGKQQHEQCKQFVISEYKKEQEKRITNERNKLTTRITNIKEQIAEHQENIKHLHKGFSLEELQNQKKILTLDQVISQEIETYKFTSPFSNLFGNPEKSFIAMIHGDSGSGKSCFAINFASYFAMYGKCVYCPLEEQAFSVSFQEKVKRYAKYNKFDVSAATTIDNIAKELNGVYDLIVIDSVSYAGFSVNDIYSLTLKRRQNKTSYLLVLHNTKNGDYKGDSSFGHLTDINLNGVSGTITVEKNRYRLPNISDETMKIWE